jgi:NAD(P)-dependent dehydrogenase (short-subunit alcohol dehydrogenase family)
VICARDEAKLVEAKREILEKAGKGATVETFSADIADEASCKALVEWLNAKHGGVDFLINNAGRSIRRAIEASYDRFHDFERTMQLNYFGCLRVTMGLLPGMVAKKKGHIVNISSIGVLTNAPRWPMSSEGGARRLTVAPRASTPILGSPSRLIRCWCEYRCDRPDSRSTRQRPGAGAGMPRT